MRSRRVVLTVTAAALLATGCGSSNNDSSSNAGTTQSFQTFVSAAYKYARCMRSHGVPSFPDPQVVDRGATQAVRQQVITPQGSAGAFKTADRACKAFAPGPGSQSAAEQAAQRHAHLEVRLTFAHCLRSHGVRNFPDPSPQGQLNLTMVRAAGVDLQARSFLPAARACVGVTHGEITVAQIEQAIHSPTQ